MRIDSTQILVELDDEQERRFSLRFEPYQAFRTITADCWTVPSAVDAVSNRVLEITDSEWKRALESVLARVDSSADFMRKSRHFLIPCQDKFIEIVAWGVSVNTGTSSTGR